MATAARKEYEGMCHCTAVRFTIRIPALEPPTSTPVIDCNCSICIKTGYLLVYPERADVTWLHGTEHLKAYRPFSGRTPHYFCSLCGISIYIDAAVHPRGDVLPFNVRLLRGVDLKALTYEPCDGRSENQPEYNDKYF